MGIDVELQDENSQTIASISDPRGLILKFLPPISDRTSVCLRFIDPFGMALFNGLQAKELVNEIEERLAKTNDKQISEHWGLILDLAKEAASDSHLYLKFVGD